MNKEARRKATKKYKKKNKEKIKIYNKNYYKLNKDYYRAHNKNYKKSHKEKIRTIGRKSDKKFRSKIITWWMMGHSLPYWKNRLKKTRFIKLLTPEYMEELTRTQMGCCYYTGIPLRPFKEGNKIKGTKFPLSRRLQQVSIDKLDPKKGYVKGNVVLASQFVNNMKGQCTLNQFKSLISLISKRHNIGKKFQDESFNRIRNKIRKMHVRGVLKDRKRIQKMIGKKSMEIQRDYQESLKKKN